MHEQRRETILVVDDDQELRGGICRILRREGYTAIPAGRGIEAQWCVEQHGAKVDLLIAGLAGPEGDAYHLGIPLGRLLSCVPVLFISASAREAHVRSGLLHPHTPFLRTPIPPAILTRRIRQLLDRLRLHPLM